MKKIALLGATGFIGKSLAFEFSKRDDFEVSLVARSEEKVREFVKQIQAEDKFKIKNFEVFGKDEYDVIINCTGIGNPKVLKEDPVRIFKTTEDIDELILAYIKGRPQTLYINLSSGAVYNISPTASREELLPKDFYAAAKRDSETRHRALSELNMADIRIFSFFSRFIDLDSGFLMSEITDCIKNKKIFMTSREDIVRDYVGPGDLLALIMSLMKQKKVNDFFDAYSAKPVSKLELLNKLHEEYHLEYSFSEAPVSTSPTGAKPSYFSKNKKSEHLGYSPRMSSLEVIVEEIGKLL